MYYTMDCDRVRIECKHMNYEHKIERKHMNNVYSFITTFVMLLLK